MIVWILLIVLVFCSLSICNVQVIEYFFVKVVEFYLDLCIGLGCGYLVIQIVEWGDWVEVMVCCMDWFKVCMVKGFIGWVYQNDIVRMVSFDGEVI